MFGQLYKNASAIPRDGDFVNSQGLLICGKCRQARETFIKYPPGSGNYIKKPITCQCDIEDEEEYQRNRKLESFQERVAELRRQGITDEAYALQRFETDDNRNQSVTKQCRRYVECWEQMKENCYGITFTGAVGGGKSFYACCIANALIDRGMKVLVTRLSDLVRNRLDHDNSTINWRDFELIVLDDIGVEGATQTAYSIVDDIYRANIPLIVTTNLSLSQLKGTQDMDKQRIYDRILQRACVPIKVDVSVTRLDIAKRNAAAAQAILDTV